MAYEFEKNNITVVMILKSKRFWNFFRLPVFGTSLTAFEKNDITAVMMLKSIRFWNFFRLPVFGTSLIALGEA